MLPARSQTSYIIIYEISELSRVFRGKSSKIWGPFGEMAPIFPRQGSATATGSASSVSREARSRSSTVSQG